MKEAYVHLDFPGIHTDCGRNCRVQKTIPWRVNTAHDRGCDNMTDLTFLQFHVLFHCSCVKSVHNVAVVEVGLELTKKVRQVSGYRNNHKMC